MGFPTQKELKQGTYDLFSLINFTVFMKTLTAKNQIQPVSAPSLGKNFVQLMRKSCFFRVHFSHYENSQFKVLFLCKKKILD